MTLGPDPDLDLDPSLFHLLARLGLVEARIDRAAAEHARTAAGGVGDLLTTDALIEASLMAAVDVPDEVDREEAARRSDLADLADRARRRGEPLRLARLGEAFGLTPLDEELLLIALAPSIDERFGGLYAYLHSDSARRHATVGMALRLCGLSPTSSVSQGRFAPQAPLVRAGLVRLEAAGRPLLDLGVDVPPRVVRHLLGDDEPDPVLVPLLATPHAAPTSVTPLVQRSVSGGSALVYVHDPDGVSGDAGIAAAFAACGLGTLLLEVDRIPADADVEPIARAAGREARLVGAGLVVARIDALAERGEAAVRHFTELAGPVVLVSRARWDPGWSRQVVATITAERFDSEATARLWKAALSDEVEDTASLVRGLAPFRLTPTQIDRAAATARHLAAAEGVPLGLRHARHGVRDQNATGLQRLTRRIEPRVAWEDLIVAPDVELALREIPMRWRHRDRVLDDWGMGRGVASGRGVSAMFAGPSGTGKTLAAEVIAADLALDLYVVDLSTVVDKYIGETSKNLDRIFDEADRVNGVLLFDEADALFGKRSAVSDAKDRHANVEVAFLLQRMEAFDGVAILTTNLAANLDDAFLRRLDAIVDFAMPSPEQREAMWRAKLARVPVAPDLDVEALAHQFTLSGAEIANAIVSAAYHSADRGDVVTRSDIAAAVLREHRKLGRHLTAADMGDWRPEG